MKDGTGKTIDLPLMFGPEMHEDPYAVYRTLRENDPVYWDEKHRAWVLTRYDDVAWALKSLSSDRISFARERFSDAGLGSLWDAIGALMTQRDEPDHTRLRALVQKAFHRSSVEHWTGAIERRLRSLLAPGLARGEMEFIDEVAVPLPVLIISELVGVPEADRDRVKRWCDDISLVVLNFYANITAEQLARGLASLNEFRAYLETQVEDCLRAPRQDLLSALVLAEHEGHTLTLDELLANTILLLNAGNETTSNLLSTGLYELLRRPEQIKRLREEPALIPSAVEECLRYDSPVQFMGRVAAADTDCAGTPIRRGQLVVAVMAAANRDPAHFPEPDRFDVARHPNFHLAFGHGHHHCVGSELGRLEARMVFTTLLTELSTLELVPAPMRHRENFNMRCYQSLPIRLSA